MRRVLMVGYVLLDASFFCLYGHGEYIRGAISWLLLLFGLGYVGNLPFRMHEAHTQSCGLGCRDLS